MVRRRRAVRALAMLAVLLIGLTVIALVVSQTPWFRERVRRLAMRQAEQVVDGTLVIGAVEGNFASGVTLRDVELRQGETTVVRVARVELAYSIGDVLSSARVVRRITVDGPVIEAVRTEAGWNLARLLKPRPPADPTRPRATFALPEIRVTDAQVRVREIGVPETHAIPRRVDGLTFEGGVSSSPAELSVDVRRLTFRTGQPDLDLRSLAGRIVGRTDRWRFQSIAVRTAESSVDVDGTLSRPRADAPWAFDLAVTGQPISLPEIGRFLPAVARPVHPRLDVRLTGSLEALGLDVDVAASEAGRARGRLTLDATGPTRGLKGSLEVADVDLAPIVQSAQATGRITGRTSFDLRFPSESVGHAVDGTFAFAGPAASAYGFAATDVRATGRLDGRFVRLDASAAAYGGRLTTRGTIARPTRDAPDVALDLAGRVSGVDLRRLPPDLAVPRLDTALAGTYRVTGPLSTLAVDATLAASTVEGATLADGTTGHFARTAGGFTFGAAGTVAGLDLHRLGTALEVAALGDPRLAGTVNGTFEVAGEQRRAEGLRLEASGILADTTLLDARLSGVAVTAALDGARLDVTAKGQVADLDLAKASGVAALEGTLSGMVDARVTLPDVAEVALDSIGVSGTVALERSTILRVPFDAVTADIALDGGLMRIARLDARGRGFTLTGAGALGVGADDESDFAYRLEAASVVEPAKVADLPLTGAATAVGRITGRPADFLVTGTVAGDQVAWSDVLAAGTVTAQYAVRLPDFAPEALDVQASIDAEQVSVAGQALPTVAGTVGYRGDEVTFDATGSDGTRDLGARGSVRLGPSVRQVALDRLDVQRGDVRWGLASGTTARVALTDAQATIAELHLASGSQRVAVEGTVALAEGAASSLRVEATGVDVSDLLTLADQDVDVDGTLEISATLGGTRERPLADGRFAITGGRVRKLDVQRLGGRVDFDGTLGIIDIELVRDGYARVTARGIVPRTILEGMSEAPLAATPADRLDVVIVSTPIDLALAEGLTSYVEQLGGQAQLDVRLTGSGRDPRVEGAVFLTDGTFRVPLTGVTYKNIDAVLTFAQERLVISELGIETTTGDVLTVEGELGISRKQANDVSLRLRGRNFRVFDNQFGVLDVHPDLTIRGTALAPVVEGRLEVANARLDVGRIVPQVASGAYATRAEYQGIPTERLRGAVVPDLLGEDDRAPRLGPGTTTFAIAPPAAGDDGVAPDGPATTSAAAATAPAADEGSVFDSAALNVQVRIPDNLILRGTDIEAARMSIGDLNATVGGEFRVAKATDEPVVLLGAVNTVRGTYSYQGRQFEIVRDGQIAFRGDEEIDPGIDITAQRRIQGVEARVRLQGTARNPQLSLSSDPPLDESDILALIIFNQPLNQLGTRQQNSVSQRAGGVAAGFVVSPLAQALGGSLSLDQFEVQTTDDTGRVNPAVVIGEQVSQDLFLRFRQQFGNQEVSQFLLEYRIADFLRLQGNVAEGDGLSAGNRSLTQRIERYGMDLVFYFAF